MPMVFCRGCGKEIHDTAPHCPHCGAPQAGSVTIPTGSPWLGITSVVLAIIAAISAAQVHTFDSDQIVGASVVSVVAFAAGAINLQQKKPGKGMSITAIVMAAVSFLVLIGT